MKLGSLFDGAGGFPLAGILAGITPVWASEIEPFPIRVTTKRFPNMRHLGDISKVNGGEIEPVDIITFGSPCQDLSVANGNRKGLDGERSGLFREAIRIIKEMRTATNGIYPAFIVWENVPGAFSSNKGADFHTVLQEIVGISDAEVSIPKSDKWEHAGEIIGEGWSIAWRVYDAQFWGVPQRRRRIFLVADFTGHRAGKVSFERESLLRDITPSGSETQGTANIALECVEQPNKTAFGFHGHKSITGNICYNEERSPCLETKMPPNVMVYDYNRQDARITECDDKAQTVLAKYGTGGNNTPIVCVQGNTIERSDTAGANGKGVIEDTSYTLNTADRHAVAYCLDRASYNQGKNAQFDISIQEELAQTCVAKGPHAVCHAAEVYTIGNGQTDQLRLHDKALTLNCMHDQQIALLPDDWDYIVRRLTPLECCRLQGFPDWWAWGLETPEPSEDDILYWSDVHEQHRIITKPINKKTGELVAAKTRNQIIKWIKDPQNDGAEYKMWGNSLAIPCAYTVLAGIAEEMRVTT